MVWCLESLKGARESGDPVPNGPRQPVLGSIRSMSAPVGAIGFGFTLMRPE